jgi:Luciferase-like monooxygenase
MKKSGMRYGLYVPNFGKVSATTYLELAREAEKAGWDGFFLWDHIVEFNQRVQLFDSFTILAAIAATTKRIRIGTTVTPLPRLKPWVVARQTACIDHLSKGRMTLGAGLGGEESVDYERFDESADPKVLAQKLDESLEIIAGLWTGKEFSYNQGKYFKMGKSLFLPAPIQKPRIPIWVGGMWPRKGPFKRAAKWDGTIPLRAPGKLLEPSDLFEILPFVKDLRKNTSNFDVVVIGWTTGTNRAGNAEKVSRYANAGANWWLESLYTQRDSSERMFARIRLGPPK